MKNPPLDYQRQGDHGLRRASEKNSPDAEPSKSKTEPEFIFIDGAMVPFASAAEQVSKMAAGNGANVFEGLCLYSNSRGQFLFRLKDHIANLRKSAWRLDLDCDYADEDFVDAIVASVRKNRIAGDAHVRLSLFVTGDGTRDASGPVSLVCTARARAASPIHNRTVHAAISSWRRVEDPLMPPRVRSEANSHNTRFGLLEVLRNGYDQAIFVSKAGKVGCGANASFLMLRGGCLISPPETAETEERVTRSTLLQIAAEELGLEVEEREIDRKELTYADEAMFCGSGMEIRPVVSINKMRIGEGIAGPITRQLWHAYESVVRGRNESRADWLTLLEKPRRSHEKPSGSEWEMNGRRMDVMRSGEYDGRFPLRTGQIGSLLESGYQVGDSSIG